MILKFLIKFFLKINIINFFYKLNLKILKINLLAKGYCTSWTPITNKSNNLFLGEIIFIKKLNNLNLKLCIDIGANTGEYSFEILKNTKLNCVAFEPLKECMLSLERLKTKFSNRLKIYNIAISNIKSKRNLYYGANNYLLSSFEKKINHITKVKNNNSKKIKCKTDTLDNLHKILKLKNVDLIKIDTEGHEKKVLLGAKKFLLLTNAKIIQIEFNWHHLFMKNSIFEFSQILKNYKVFQLDLYNGIPREINPKDPMSNVYFLSIFIFVNKDYYLDFKKVFN
jgi:FkbM family methyltransferase